MQRIESLREAQDFINKAIFLGLVTSAGTAGISILSPEVSRQAAIFSIASFSISTALDFRLHIIESRIKEIENNDNRSN